MRINRTTWKIATGNCGFNTDGDVHAAYIKDHAVFAFESKRSTAAAPLFHCIVVGRTCITATKLEDVKTAGADFARNYKDVTAETTKRGLTVKEFAALVARPNEPLLQAA